MTGGPGGEPATLYHFTTADGLQGIVEKSLWATDAEFLNDSQELQFGRPELVAALTAEADRIQYGAAEGGPDYARGAVLRSTAETLRSGAPPAATQEHLVHVACFCAADDLLSLASGGDTGPAVGSPSGSTGRRWRPSRRSITGSTTVTSTFTGIRSPSTWSRCAMGRRPSTPPSARCLPRWPRGR